MLERLKLKINWATHESTRFACENYHYSRCLPTGKLVKIGAWENDSFIGAVIFSRGASPYLCRKYNLPQEESCELTRIALKKHSNPVTMICALALRFLKAKCPGKHRYLYPLQMSLRLKLLENQEPYPKRVVSIGSDALGDQLREGGVSPTTTLQNEGIVYERQ